MYATDIINIIVACGNIEQYREYDIIIHEYVRLIGMMSVPCQLSWKDQNDNVFIAWGRYSSWFSGGQVLLEQNENMNQCCVYSARQSRAKKCANNDWHSYMWMEQL